MTPMLHEEKLLEPRKPTQRLPNGVHVETMGAAYRQLDQQRYELEQEVPDLQKRYKTKFQKARKAAEEERQAQGRLEGKQKEIAMIERQLEEMRKTASLAHEPLEVIEGKESQESMARPVG